MNNLQPLPESVFTQKGVEVLHAMIVQSITERGACMLGLSGGKTPAAIYTELGKSADIDWNLVSIFLCDERCVPPSHDDSNQKMIRTTLLAHAKISESNLYFPDTSVDPPSSAAAYAQELDRVLATPADVIVLGLGGDGHIASLFPPLPNEAFGPQKAIHTQTDAFAVKDRISVTLPVITSATHRILLLKGKDKLSAWRDMEMDTADERFWPIKAVMETGELEVVVGE